jgi:hypothetical protein
MRRNTIARMRKMTLNLRMYPIVSWLKVDTNTRIITARLKRIEMANKPLVDNFKVHSSSRTIGWRVC